MTSQTQMALGLLESFGKRSLQEMNAAKFRRICALLYRIRQAEAEAAYREMERLGTPRVPGEIDDEQIPF
jgi:hypothetical protein